MDLLSSACQTLFSRDCLLEPRGMYDIIVPEINLLEEQFS
jgi:hypothetical protein